MEGPAIRAFARTLLDSPVELLVGDKPLAGRLAPGNVSPGGLFVRGPALPVGTPVQVKIVANPPVRVDGVIRYCEASGEKGVGIEFTRLTDANRKHLDELIAELTRKGLPAC